ncbi:MAG: Asp-tRNA(Asn)/Glu-tRNA(Gln) amidotransferase subunit GatB [archaeon]
MVKKGLEIHGYIVSNEKLFCRCPATYKTGAKPNTNICPICTGYPGSKPMLPNDSSLNKIVAIGLMMGCKISQKGMSWQRKHYDWPDLPKGYQDTISGAYSVPVGVEGEFLGIKIREVHLEEDPAKWDPQTGYVDFNRCGLPLVEIVTEPDFKSSAQVLEWLKSLITTLSYIKAVEKDAGIKADVNVSTSGERVEIKNVNSFESIVNAIEYEIKRQDEETKKGNKIARETRAFDDKKGITITMRQKEEQAEYRFIPDPDLPVISLRQDYVSKIASQLPEMPHEKKDRFVKEHDIDKEIAHILTTNLEIAEFYESVLSFGIDKKLASYWVVIELTRVLNWNKKSLEDVEINPEHFAELIKLVSENKITENAAKKMLNEFIPKSFSPQSKLASVSRIEDKQEIESICKEVISKNQKAAEDYRKGEEKALHFLLGQVMAATKGRADNKIAREVILALFS